jgi:hypothetical protein
MMARGITVARAIDLECVLSDAVRLVDRLIAKTNPTPADLLIINLKIAAWYAARAEKVALDNYPTKGERS